MKIPTTTREERLALLARNNVTQTPVPETPRGVGMGSGNNNGKTKGKGKEPRVPKKQHDNNHLPNEAKPSLEVRNKARLASIKLYDYWKN